MDRDLRTEGEEPINNLVTAKLSQQQYDALVVLVFNIGKTNFAGSTVRKMINDPGYKSGQYRNLESAWKAWNKLRGKTIQGLINRRRDEWEMWSKGDYKRDY